jgi:hypothetical protein
MYQLGLGSLVHGEHSRASKRVTGLQNLPCWGWGGLRQGDPLLPMLFLLVMEVLHTLIYMLDQWSLF